MSLTRTPSRPRSASVRAIRAATSSSRVWSVRIATPWMLREAVAARLPPLPISPELAARLIEPQWQGALNQWGFFREGPLPDFVAASLQA